MPKKETSSRASKMAGKELAGGDLTAKEQAGVNASPTSEDETPKKEKKKAEKKKAEKKKKKKKNDRRLRPSLTCTTVSRRYADCPARLRIVVNARHVRGERLGVIPPPETHGPTSCTFG
jgi:hypothetical protein